MIYSMALFLAFLNISEAQTFQSGVHRTVVPIEGQVTVFCQLPNGDEQKAEFICRDRVMEPSPYDFFVGPRVTGEKGLSVELTARDAQGGLRTKVLEYIGPLGRTEDRLNLWISNPFQKPLLRLGRNWVKYRVYNRQNRVFEENEFISDVSMISGRTCPRTTYRTSNPNDCVSQYTVCQQYFEQFNFCH